MCYYISTIISNDYAIEDLNFVGGEYGFSFEACNNEFVQKQLKFNQKYLIKNCVYCDCGTTLGGLHRIKNSEVRIERRDLEKIKKKGWSETKIKHWIENKQKAIENNRRKTDIYINKISCFDWLEFIKELFVKTNIKHFGVLLHWYKGGVESERIKINEVVHIHISNLTENDLLTIEDDKIYRIYK